MLIVSNYVLANESSSYMSEKYYALLEYKLQNMFIITLLKYYSLYCVVSKHQNAGRKSVELAVSL